MFVTGEIRLIRHLEDALALADEIEDGHRFLIERALDEAAAEGAREHHAAGRDVRVTVQR